MSKLSLSPSPRRWWCPRAGRFLRLDTRRAEGVVAGFASTCGMALYDVVTTMSLGGRRLHSPKPDGTLPYTFAPANHVFG